MIKFIFYLKLKNIKVDAIYPVLPHDILKKEILKKKKKKINIFIKINRLDKNKNIQLIINSFIKGFKNKNAVLKIIGNGPEIENLINISKTSNIKKKIFFIKNIDKK